MTLLFFSYFVQVPGTLTFDWILLPRLQAICFPFSNFSRLCLDRIAEISLHHQGMERKSLIERCLDGLRRTLCAVYDASPASSRWHNDKQHNFLIFKMEEVKMVPTNKTHDNESTCLLVSKGHDNGCNPSMLSRNIICMIVLDIM